LRLNWSYGVVRARHLDETIALLRAVPEGNLAIVACHHPLIDGATKGAARTAGGGEALAALAAGGAQAVLSGHVHDPFDRPWTAQDGAQVRMIGAGTLSERVRTSRPSFNELVVADGSLRVTPQLMD
jgi:3',5'-cyclic AMP phosphodiesterase CpdA